MPHISKQTPAPYYQRYSDWYKGAGKEICHAIGLMQAEQFYAKCELEAQEIDLLFPNFPVIDILEGFLINVKRQYYNKNYLRVYDDAANQGCKYFERLDGQVQAVLGQIQPKVDEAKAYIHTNLISPIQAKINNEITPFVNSLNSKVTNLNNQIGSISNISQNAQTAAANAQSTAQTAYNNAVSAYNKAAALTNSLSGVDAKISELTSKATNAETNINNVIADLNKKTQALNGILADLQAKTNDINGNIKPRLEKAEQKLNQILNNSSDPTTPTQPREGNLVTDIINRFR